MQETFGGKIESVDDYDEMMDTWGELMEAGEYGAVLALLDAKLPPVPGIPPLDEFINWVRMPHRLLCLHPAPGRLHQLGAPPHQPPPWWQP